jgi:hypothetical protein
MLAVVARMGVLEHAFWYIHEPPAPDWRASLQGFWGSNGGNARVWGATTGAEHGARGGLWEWLWYRFGPLRPGSGSGPG